MTDAQLDALLAEKRLKLAQDAARQREELRQRQQAGHQRVGPWAPAATLTKPRRRKARAIVTPLRRTG